MFNLGPVRPPPHPTSTVTHRKTRENAIQGGILGEFKGEVALRLGQPLVDSESRSRFTFRARPHSRTLIAKITSYVAIADVVAQTERALESRGPMRSTNEFLVAAVHAAAGLGGRA